MAASNPGSAVKLVFTAAVKREIPVRWLADRDAGVFSIRRLKAEGVGIVEQPILIVITGVGPRASSDAAVWIRDNLSPFSVVNLGTAASVSPDFCVGDWVMPEISSGRNDRDLRLDTRIPFPWSGSGVLKRGGAIFSVSEPMCGGPPFSVKGASLVDMESRAQAEVFCERGIPFHVVKSISDLAGPDSAAQYESSLEPLRKSIEALYEFLEQPGEPDVSVVIPVHNRQDRIGPCIESVLSQTMAPKEVIVVDDGSTDQTSMVLRRFDGRIDVVALPENRGVSCARNVGAERAEGRWICFLDSDDLWKENKLWNQWSFIRRHPFFQIVQSEEIWIRDGVRVNSQKHHAKPDGWIWSRSLDLCLVSPSAVLLKKSLFDEHGGFDESLPACEDYDLWIRISRDHPVGLDPTLSVVKHGGHSDQLSRRFEAMDRFRVRSLVKAMERETDPIFRARLSDVLKRKAGILAQGCRKRGRPDEASYFESLTRPCGAREGERCDAAGDGA